MKKNFNLKKIFLIIIIASLSIGALIGIIIFLFGDFGELEFRLLLSTIALAGFSLTGLSCSILYGKKRFIALAILGIIISIVGLTYTLLMIWKFMEFWNEDLVNTLIIFIVLAFSVAHICLLLLIKFEKSLVKYFLSATIFFIILVAYMIINIVLKEFDFSTKNDLGELYYRLLGVYVILDVLGTIVTPIISRVYANKY